MTDELYEKTAAYLKMIKSKDELPTAKSNIFRELYISEGVNPSEIENPTNAVATEDYEIAADANAGDETYPTSVQEGLQTIVNMARVKAKFNPLDPTKEKSGSKQKFLDFTNNLASCPMLTIANYNYLAFHQESHNADDLINSFVAGFKGIQAGDISDIKTALKSLVYAALSWATQEQRLSNFTQNVLQVGKVSALCNFYCSEFYIKADKKKGTIIYESAYTLMQTQYSLPDARWSRMRELFESEEKTSMEEYLESMKTKTEGTGKVRAICLEPK